MIKVTFFGKAVGGKNVGEPLFVIEDSGNEFLLTVDQFVDYNRSKQK